MTKYSIGDILYSDEIGWHVLLVEQKSFCHPHDQETKMIDWEVIIIETGETNWYEDCELDQFFEKVA